MTKVAIIYFSGSGHTHLQAEAVAAGARSVADTGVELLRIQGSQIREGRWKDEAFIAKLDAADGIVFGAVTYMGGPAAQFKAFADWSGEVWFRQGWKDRTAGGFTHSGTPSGDKVATMNSFITLACQHSMVWISTGIMPSQVSGDGKELNRLGGFSGVMGAGGAKPGEPAVINEGDRATAEAYGRRFAEITAKLHR